MPDLDDVIAQLRGMSPRPQAAARPWFDIRAAADNPKRVTLRIYDEISWWGTDARTFAQHLDEIDAEEIDLRLNSPGGNAWDGLAIMNALRAKNAKVIVTVDGMAASAASAIAMAGDEVRMNLGSQMMVHKPYGVVIGDEDALDKAKVMFGKLAESYADVYAARAGGTSAEWRDIMRAETWYTAKEAVDAGLADSTVDDKAASAVTASASFDLKAYAFAYAGRDAAPPPKITHPPTPAPEQTPGASSCPPQTAAEAMRRVHAAATKTTTASPAGGNKEGATQVTDPVKLREALGLAPDASDDEVRTAASASLGLPAAPAANPPEQSAAALPAGAAPGTVVLSESAWQQTQDQLRTLASFVEQTKRNERDAYLASAIGAGKFTPAQKDHFAKLWDSNPDATRGLIDAMTPNAAFATDAYGYATADGDDFEHEYQRMVSALGGGR